MATRKRTSIADVAREAGVSKSTVSFVLNNKSADFAIADATRRRVLDIARKIGYQPPVPHVYQPKVAKLLRHISLAFVNPGGETDHEFLAPAFYALTRAAGEQGLLVRAPQAVKPDRAKKFCDDLLKHDTDGVIVFTFFYEREKWIDDFLASRLPLVVFNRDFGPDVPCVVMDHAGQAAAQVKRMLNAGHRRIACLGTRVGTALERLEGYRSQLRAAGCYDAALEFACDYSVTDADAAGRKLLAQHRDVTAVLCTTDEVAVGMMRAARESKRPVPRELSVASLDGYDFSRYTEPPLSTVRYPRKEMGRAALELLRKVAMGKAPAPPRVVVRGEEITGETIAPRQA